MTELRRWQTPLVIFGIVLLFTAALSFLPPVRFSPEAWAGWQPDGCRTFNCFCEPFRGSAVLQTASSYSNLGYVLVALLILYAPLTPASNLIEARPAYRRVFGVAAIVIGFGSFFYHATLTRAGEWFDLMGMYLFAGFLMLYNLARLRPLSGSAFTLAYVALAAAGGVQMMVARELQQWVFGGLIAGALIFEALVWWMRRPRLQRRYFVAALGGFAAGAAVWVLDSRLPCFPDSSWQWHAVWHLLTAAAAGLMYIYYRSEMTAD